MKYITRLPFEGVFRVTNHYGAINSIYVNRRHEGLDLASSVNPNVYSICDGRVSYAGWENINNTKQGFGQYVSIQFDETSNGYKRVFLAHLKSINVSKGQKVTPATIIGEMGSTGFSTGPHTHVEIREYNSSGRMIRKLNPATYMGIPNERGTYDSVNYRIYSNNNSYTTGRYKVNTPKGVNVRTGPGLEHRIITLNEMTQNARKQGGYINGTVFDVFEVSNNWGKTPSGWVCLDYAVKIS